MDQNSIRKIIEDRITALEGFAFQDFCDRLGLVLYPGDYTPVRAGGKTGDDKNDGYCPKARVFFQAHATRGEEISDTKAKVKKDLAGCVAKHRDIKHWIYLTNIPLIGTIETFIDDLRPSYPKITIETWDRKKIARTISNLSLKEVEYILDINLTPVSKLTNDHPTVDIIPPLGRSGGPNGHFESFTLKNIGKASAVDCIWGIMGDQYEWSPPDSYLGKTLLPAQEIKEVPYKISDEPTFTTIIKDLKVFIKYYDEDGHEFITYRELKQVLVPSGAFYNLELGRFFPANQYVEPKQAAVAKPTHSQKSEGDNIEKFEYLLESAHWDKEFIDEKEVWICKKNPLYQVEECDDHSDFTEQWTQVYPDKFGSGKFSVNLKIWGVTVKQLTFVFCDGGRISVPVPRMKVVNDQLLYYWVENSIEFKLGQKIGNFYIYGDLQGIAAMSKIEIIS
jgi:hypothetical protein